MEKNTLQKKIATALTLGVLSTTPMKANSALINCTNSFGTDNATFSCLNNTGLPSNGIEIDLTSLYGNNNSDYSLSINNGDWIETGDNSDGLYTFDPEFSAFNWENADNLIGLITYDTTSQDSRFFGLDMSLQTLGDVPLTAYDTTGIALDSSSFSLPTIPEIKDSINVSETNSFAMVGLGLILLGYTANERKKQTSNK